MKNLTFACSAILIILGAVGYFGWEAIGASQQSITAAIPAFVGILMLVGGLIALKNNMAGMHVAALFALLGGLAGLGRLIPQMGKDDFSWSEASTISVAIMTVVCLFYIVMAIRSFIAARKARG
ncbi:MAG: hypothetical protein WD342_13065 [Verrucomicrobiales bacterium]